MGYMGSVWPSIITKSTKGSRDLHVWEPAASEYFTAWMCPNLLTRSPVGEHLVVSSLGYHESCCCEFSWICLPWTQALTLCGYLPRCGGWTTLSTVVVPAHTPSGEVGQSNWGSSGLLSAAISAHGLVSKMEAPQCTVALSGPLSLCPTNTGTVAVRTGRLWIITSGVWG